MPDGEWTCPACEPTFAKEQKTANASGCYDSSSTVGHDKKEAADTETDPLVEALRDGKKQTLTSFSDRLEELRQYKIKHGHVNVKEAENKSLYHYCLNIRLARNGKGKAKITPERIASLDALGFDWDSA